MDNQITAIAGVLLVLVCFPVSSAIADGAHHTVRDVKVTIKDPLAAPISPAQMDWTGFSASEKAVFEQAFHLQKQSHFAESARQYQELSVQVSNFAVWYNLGLVEAGAGNLINAESALKKSAHLNPQLRETHKLLSDVQQALGKSVEAKASLNRYKQL